MSYEGQLQDSNGNVLYPEVLNKYGFRVVGSNSTTATTYNLDSSKTWLIVTGHNSTTSLNGMWLFRPGTGYVFHLSSETSTVTITGATNGDITVKTNSGTVNIYALSIG